MLAANLKLIQNIISAARSVSAEIEGSAAHERLQLARTQLHNTLRDGKDALAELEAEIPEAEAREFEVAALISEGQEEQFRSEGVIVEEDDNDDSA